MWIYGSLVSKRVTHGLPVNLVNVPLAGGCSTWCHRRHPAVAGLWSAGSTTPHTAWWQSPRRPGNKTLSHHRSKLCEWNWIVDIYISNELNHIPNNFLPFLQNIVGGIPKGARQQVSMSLQNIIVGIVRRPVTSKGENCSRSWRKESEFDYSDEENILRHHPKWRDTFDLIVASRASVNCTYRSDIHVLRWFIGPDRSWPHTLLQYILTNIVWL